MSGSDWSRYLTALKWGCAGVVAVAALVITWTLGALNASYFQQAEQAARQHSQDTDQRIADACLYRPGYVECANKIIKASQEAQNAEHDLAAQRSMALWALGVFWATTCSVIATGIGIVLVRRTLDVNRAAVAQARQANEIAKDIGEAQVRAYLSIVEPGIAFNNQRPIFRIRLTNAGNSPAMFIRANCLVTFGFWDMDGAAEARSHMIVVAGLSSQQSAENLDFPFDVRLSDHPSANPNSMVFRLVIDLEWTNAFNKEDGCFSSFLIKTLNPLDEERITATIIPEYMTLGKRPQMPSVSEIVRLFDV